MTRTPFIWLLLVLLGCMATLGVVSDKQNISEPSGTVAVLPFQPDSVVYTSAVMSSNDDYSGRQWAIPKTMAPQAWEVTSGAKNVVIAVLDTGIDKHQEDLAGKVIAEVNLTDSPTTDDIYGHGTHIAGIIAAVANNNVGIAGLAYNCSLMNVKVADDRGRFDNAVAARGVIWAVDHGAKVINMSLVSTEPSACLEEAVNYAWNHGAVVIAAAGNLVGDKIVYPAYYSNCIAVAASDSNDCVASWSSHGDWVDVAAPGVDIYSTLPDNKYGNKSGTSMAAAQVSGLAGLLLALKSDKNSNGSINDEVRAAIENGCDELNTGTVKGRINAFHAVSSALTSN
jgi:thermitase